MEALFRVPFSFTSRIRVEFAWSSDWPSRRYTDCAEPAVLCDDPLTARGGTPVRCDETTRCVTVSTHRLTWAEHMGS